MITPEQMAQRLVEHWDMCNEETMLRQLAIALKTMRRAGYQDAVDDMLDGIEEALEQ